MGTTFDTYANITSALAQTYSVKLARQWNRRVVLARKIPINSVSGFGHGQNVAWDTEMTGAAAEDFAEGADVGSTAFTYDTIVPAVLNWGRYRSNFALSFDEIDLASANVGNAEELGKIFEERFIGAVSSIASRINTDMYSGTGTSNANPVIVGLDAAIGTTSTYATISRSGYTAWAGTVVGNSSINRALTMELLSHTEGSVYTASGYSPNMPVCDPAIYTKYESLFVPMVRTLNDGVGPVQSFQGSASKLYWRGEEVARDKDATANTMYLLNTEEDELELRVLKPAGWTDMPGAIAGGAGKVDEPLAIPCRVYRVPQAGSRVAFSVEVRCQLVVRHPNRHARITDVLES